MPRTHTNGQPGSSPRLMGSSLVLTSAVLYGVSPILAKVVYAYGVSPLMLLALRSTFAAICLWLGLGLRRMQVRPSRSSILPLLVIGTTLVPIQVFAYFFALVYLPASSASVLGSTAPLHVAWMGWVFLGERVRRVEVALLFGIVAGAVLVAGQTPVVNNGIGFVSVGAATLVYATYMVVARRMMRDVLPLTAMATILPVSAAVYWGAGLVTGQMKFPVPLPALLATLASALLATLIAPILFLSGLRVIPAARAAILGTLEIVVTVTLSVLLLGDLMTPLRVIGIATVLSGIAILHVQRSA